MKKKILLVKQTLNGAAGGHLEDACQQEILESHGACEHRNLKVKKWENVPKI
jgi:hypothetical protein